MNGLRREVRGGTVLGQPGANPGKAVLLACCTQCSHQTISSNHERLAVDRSPCNDVATSVCEIRDCFIEQYVL